jgi:hypothetical protein
MKLSKQEKIELLENGILRLLDEENITSLLITKDGRKISAAIAGDEKMVGLMIAFCESTEHLLKKSIVGQAHLN